MKLTQITLMVAYFICVFTNEIRVESIVKINKIDQDLKTFCKDKNLHFCSKENMKLSMDFLQNQLDQIKRNMERAEKEARKEANKAEKIRRRNRLREERLLFLLRQHFLDRHL